jgi:O-antigen ligase
MESEKKLDIFESLSILPFILVIFSPLVVKGKVLEVSIEASKYWNNNLVIDFFSYYKSVVIIFSSGIALLLTLIGFINKRIELKKNAISIPLIAYSMFLCLSHFFSQYPETSLFGFPERYEGILIHLSYIILFITFVKLIRTKKQITIITASIIICAGIVSIIGLTQFINHDILKTPIIKNLIFGNIYNNSVLYQYELGSSDNLRNNIYATLYNSNTLGHYMGMMLPFCVYLLFSAKSTIQKTVLTIITTLVIINLFGSLSRGSIVGSISVLLISMIIGNYIGFLSKKEIFIVVGLIVIIISLANSFSDGKIIDRVSTISEIGTNHAEDEVIDKIKQFTIRGNKIYLKSTYQALNIVASDNKVSFCDESNEILNFSENSKTGKIVILDNRFEDISVIWIEEFLKIQKGKSFLLFKLYDDNFYFINTIGEVLEEDIVESFGFEGLERMGSGRGYIWSRSLPIIRRTILFGSGVDTFAFEFPQYDYAGKLKFLYDAYLIIDKPHNLFLQMAINSGLISLLLFILFLFVWSMNIIHKIKQDNALLLFAILSSILTYLVCGLFTDSTVSVTPTFWILLALGQSYLNFNLSFFGRHPID